MKLKTVAYLMFLSFVLGSVFIIYFLLRVG